MDLPKWQCPDVDTKPGAPRSPVDGRGTGNRTAWFPQPGLALMAFANLARTTSLACIHWKCATTSFPTATPSEAWRKSCSPEWTVCRAQRTTWIGAVRTPQRPSIPFGRFAPVRQLWHLACLCHVVGAM